MDAKEVAKHNTPESCWVILYGHVYDVTEFMPHHPGGSKIILQLAGTDATEEYDPVHPPGTLEENLKPEAKLGKIDPSTLVKKSTSTKDEAAPKLEPSSLKRLLNIDDIEQAATKVIKRRSWAYYYSAADDLISKSLNNTVYRSILLRPRVFVDCTKCDISTTVIGLNSSMPVFVSPSAQARLVHPDGEHAIAQACETYKTIQMISHNASMTPEQITFDAPTSQIFGWQIYVQTDRAKSEALLARVNKIPQIKFIVLTLDAPVAGKREHDEREGNINQSITQQGVLQGGGISAALFSGIASDLTWKTTLPWLAKYTSLPIILKGLQTHEDAYLASQHTPQVKGIILSNHGGRAVDTAPPSIHTLMEIRKYCPEVFNKLDVMVDGGIKRGTDVVKALCLGAKAVGIGRAPLFGLGVGGKAGVERVFEILKAEIETCMRLLGVETVKELGLRHVNTRVLEREIYDGPAGLERTSLWAKVKL